MSRCTKPSCDCGNAELPRSDHPYVAVPVAFKPPGQREPAWCCQCTREDGRPLLRNSRHQHPEECLTLAQIEAWRAANPAATCSLRVARSLAWMAQFAPKET